MIGIMCNKGMRPRHWEKMSNTAGFDLTPDSGTTLRKVLKLDLGKYMEEFEGISAAATKVGFSFLLYDHSFYYNDPKFTTDRSGRTV